MDERNKILVDASGVNHLPLPRGKYKVGCVDILNGTTRDKGCLFRVFYPTAEENHISTDVSKRTKWLPQPEGKYADGYARVQGSVAYVAHKLLGSQTSTLHIPATTNGAPFRNACRNSFPVILFSHDIGECRTTNSSFCVELASHGCVVAALEHRDNTACRTFYVEKVVPGPDQVDGNLILQDREESDEPLQSEDQITMCESRLDDETQEDDDEHDDIGEDQPDTAAKFKLKTHGRNRTVWVNYRPIEKTPDLYNIRLRQLHRRVAECIRTLNCLETINARRICSNELPDNNSADLYGIMDMNRVSVIGRGFGGSTAYTTLQLEDRTVCGASIDPLMFVIQADRPINVCRPLLLVLNNRHTAREDVRIIKTMFRKTYTTAFTLLGSDSDAQSDLPFVRSPSMWSSLSLSWPVIPPSAFTSLDLGTSLVLRFIADKCNFAGYNAEPYEDYVQRKSNLLENGIKMPSRLFSRASNAR